MTAYVLLLIVGLVAGVVLNVLADNLPPDADNVRHRPRRPRCGACQTPHKPQYWLALAGLIAQGGRCEHCGVRRRLRPILVELAAVAGTAAVWAWVDFRADQAASAWPPLVWVIQFACALWIYHSFLLITVIDIEHRLILWNVVWPTALVVAALNVVLPDRGLVKTLAGGLVGYGVTLGIFLLAELYSRVVQMLRGQPLGEVAFGGGDVNLAGIVGLAVGWPGITLALLITVLAGGAFSLVYIVVQLVRRRYSPHTAMPYGPFLVLGGWLIYYGGRDLAALWLSTR